MNSVALKLTETSPREANRAGGVLTVAEAARLKGESEDTIRRRINRLWDALEWAWKEPPPEGGKARYVIARCADPAFAASPFPQYLPVDLSNMDEAGRRRAAGRMAMLKGYWEARAAGVRSGQTLQQSTVEFLARLKREQGWAPCASVFAVWEERYRTGGMEGLKDAKYRREGPAGDRWMLAEARRLYLADRNGMRITAVVEQARSTAEKNGWKVWSDNSVRRELRPIPLGEAIYRRQGSKAFNDRAAPYLEQDHTTHASNDLLISDGHDCDVIVKFGEKLDPKTGVMEPVYGRPTLTVWQDDRSKKIVDADPYEGAANADRILLSFRRAVLAHGVPEGVLIDNGRDYCSETLQGRTKRAQQRRQTIDPQRLFGAFPVLGVKVRRAQPYHGQSKPVERFFGTLEEHFCKRWPTYWGRSPENRPEGVQERIDAGKAPTLEEFRSALLEWIETGYNSQPHQGDGMDGKSPNQVFAECLAVKRTADERLLNLLLQKQSRPVKVGRNGCTWNGLRYGQFCPELHRFWGREVTLRCDPADVTKVTVWTLEGKFVCLAPANRRIPANASSELLRAAMREKQHDTKLRKGFQQARLRMHDDVPERMARLDAEKKAPRPLPPDDLPPPAIRPVRSPLEGELPALERALEAPALRRTGTDDVDWLKAFGDIEPPAQPHYPEIDWPKVFGFKTSAESDAEGA